MTKVENLIGGETEFKGTISTKKSIRVDGTLEGDIKNADGVILGKGGLIKGNINARSILISGKVIGNLSCPGKIEILKGGELQGDLHTTQLIISEGVTFNGKCEMSKDLSLPQEKPSPSPPEKE